MHFFALVFVDPADKDYVTLLCHGRQGGHKANGMEANLKKREVSMRKPSIAASRNKFRKILAQYVKHQGLDLEVTLKNGERITLSKMRRLEGDRIVSFNARGARSELPIQEIQQLEVYVN
ncbi:MAG: hypothetical protein N2Z22_03985 [Turneriella sp.]|nr:hypothetical protein [Leptospiraceae bacterium]MCX7632475.1 hypothetical protein [Turneriella sp.]